MGYHVAEGKTALTKAATPKLTCVFFLPYYQVVIIQPYDTGSKAHPFPYALVAGIERYPSKVTRRMGTKKVAKRSKVKPFIKTINYNHLMPTRYTLELEGLKGAITNDTFKEVSQREEAKKTVKKSLEERYNSGKNRWFFTPLRF
ncbi:60S ribosomal protein L27 [Paracoccidioides lutzii Pb01]|uniref:60S ribosomal protein L27 n=1 Tax=Paracoccidioides lutzii (strain ATCC MYA-826 / Pb01) TaxID=502779 RepID=C1GTU4_PARBA|nr:60S ribosomal protein L27 [Paracoccidioides lutzii Pb01]EEH39750.2 60S ribosomal protein L27-A [Paracoccidioides lutzii Pb01]